MVSLILNHNEPIQIILYYLEIQLVRQIFEGQLILELYEYGVVLIGLLEGLFISMEMILLRSKINEMFR